MTVTQAMQVLEEALKEDKEYAYGWHANIAMMCHDAYLSHAFEGDEKPAQVAQKIGNEAASRFMKLAFDVETSQDMLEDKDGRVQ